MKKLIILLLFIPLVFSCSKEAIIYTLTTSANPSEGGTVSPASKDYEEGETATITASPAAEYVFQSWSGTTGNSKTTSVVMNSDKTVVANFVKKQYALKISVEGEGTVSEKIIKAGVANDYNSGTIVELTANPSAEWVFSEWKGDLTGTDNPKQITIDKAKNVTAVFVKKQYPLTINVEGEGTVSEKIIKAGVTTDYNSGTIVELTANPTAEWVFSEWKGDLTGTDNPKQITIDKAKNVTAVFVKKQYPLTVTIEEGDGSVKQNGGTASNNTTETLYESGTIVELEAVNTSTWVFSEWKGDLTGTENPKQITIDGPKNITVKFELALDPFYLDDNGVTIKARSGVPAGKTGQLNGETYTAVDRATLLAMIENGDDITKVVTTLITNMENVFKEKNDFNQDISTWDVSNVTNMEGMFVDATIFNQDITKWDVSNVTNMYLMFKNTKVFNQDISKWDVSNVTDMGYMFQGAAFNQPIGNWDVSKVTNMQGMLSNAENFNQDISSWDVSNVTNMGGINNMGGMFQGAVSFNQPIGNWDVSKVTNMQGMFSYAENFNQDISSWDVSSVTNMQGMFEFAQNFNQDISKWDVSNVTDMGNMFARAYLFNQPIGSWNVSNVTKMYGTFGTALNFNQDISNWDVSSVTNMYLMFKNAENFDQDISSWDVSSVINMSVMFKNAKVFNQDISSWDVSSVTNMRSMFMNAPLFNQPIGSWDVSSVTNMQTMFNDAIAFNQPIGSWDVSSVTDMRWMFRGAVQFNQPVGDWDVSKVTTMNYMFYDATIFNQDLSKWCVSNVVEYEFFSNLSSLSSSNTPKWGTCPSD